GPSRKVRSEMLQFAVFFSCRPGKKRSRRRFESSSGVARAGIRRRRVRQDDRRRRLSPGLGASAPGQACGILTARFESWEQVSRWLPSIERRRMLLLLRRYSPVLVLVLILVLAAAG